MKKTKDNDYAYPSPLDLHSMDSKGLTKLEYMATHILVGLLANSSFTSSVDDCAKQAVDGAKYLIEALNKETK